MTASAPRRPPKVSVIVPNYNHARFLRQRLDSVLSQTFGDFELIILDDCSTDDSEAVIHQYLCDERVSYHRNTANSGSPFAQWRKGLALASGDYVWIAESDDYSDPAFLETLVAALNATPSHALAFCQSWLIDKDGQRLGTWAQYTSDLDGPRWQASFSGDGSNACVRYMLDRNVIPNASAVVFRREKALQIGGPGSDMRLAGDWLFWARMLTGSSFYFHAEPLNYFRSHGSNVRSTTHSAQVAIEFTRVRAWILRNHRVKSDYETSIGRSIFLAFTDTARGLPRKDRLRFMFQAATAGAPVFFRHPLIYSMMVARRLLRADPDRTN